MISRDLTRAHIKCYQQPENNSVQATHSEKIANYKQTKNVKQVRQSGQLQKQQEKQIHAVNIYLY